MTVWWRTVCACGADLLWEATQTRHRCAHCGRTATRKPDEGQRIEAPG